MTTTPLRHNLLLQRGRLKALAALTATIIATCSIASVATSALAADDNSGQSISIALVGDIDSMNPFIGTLADATNIQRIQYEPLVAWGQADNAESPAVAEAWQASDDGKTWVYQLDPKALWSDGTPITSNDVVWTFTSILENDSLKPGFGAYVSGIKEIRKIDEFEVEITLETAQASNPGTDVPIVPRHIWSEIDDPASFANDAGVVGSGPFVVDTYSQTSGVSMVANSNYRHGEAPIKRVNWVPYKNTDAAAQALRAGELDMVSGLTAAQYETLQKADDITAVAASGRGFRGVQINPGASSVANDPMGDGHPALRDKQFRQALVHAIDRAALNDRVLNGYGTAGSGIIPPLYPNYYIAPDSPDILGFDLERAKQILDSAGYELDSDGVRLDLEGKPIELRLFSYEHAAAQQTLDFLSGWFREIGIPTQVKVTSLAQYNDDTVMGTYDMYISGWTVRPDPDYLFGMNQCSSRPSADGSGATSLANYCGSDYDALYQKQSVETDPVARAEFIRKLQVSIDQAAVFPVFFYPDVFQAYRSDRLTNIEQQPTGNGSILYQNGGWSLHSATPVGEPSTAAAQEGIGTWLWTGAAAVALIGVGIYFARRRKGANGTEDRE